MDVAATCRAFRGEKRARGDAMGVGARASGPGSGPRGKAADPNTNRDRAMRTFFHDVLEAGVVVRGRATLDTVHDVACRAAGKSGGHAVSHPRARGERGFEPDCANDAVSTRGTAFRGRIGRSTRARAALAARDDTDRDEVRRTLGEEELD